MYPTQSAGKRLRTSHDWFQFYFDSDWTAKRRLLLKSAVSALSWWHRQDYSLGNLSNNEKLAVVVLVPQNLLISRSCFAEDGKEMYTCTAIFSLIKPFVWWPTLYPGSLSSAAFVVGRKVTSLNKGLFPTPREAEERKIIMPWAYIIYKWNWAFPFVWRLLRARFLMKITYLFIH